MNHRLTGFGRYQETKGFTGFTTGSSWSNMLYPQWIKIYITAIHSMYTEFKKGPWVAASYLSAPDLLHRDFDP